MILLTAQHKWQALSLTKIYDLFVSVNKLSHLNGPLPGASDSEFFAKFNINGHGPFQHPKDIIDRGRFWLLILMPFESKHEFVVVTLAAIISFGIVISLLLDVL
jgi:hypothetical protein